MPKTIPQTMLFLSNFTLDLPIWKIKKKLPIRPAAKKVIAKKAIKFKKHVFLNVFSMI